jgi:chromate transporter
MIYLKLFFMFFKIGLFAFGGGYVTLPMIYQEINRIGLMSTAEFSDVVAISQITPGPVAINAATYVGHKTAGMMGAVAATTGVVLPSFILVMIIAAFLNRYRNSPLVDSTLLGIRPATAGMISSAVIFFAKDSLFILQNISIPAVIIFILATIGMAKFKLNPILIVILAGVVGMFVF